MSLGFAGGSSHVSTAFGAGAFASVLVTGPLARGAADAAVVRDLSERRLVAFPRGPLPLDLCLERG